MKKLMFTAAAAIAIFAMVACNNKKTEEPLANEPATEQCGHKCTHEGDSAACCKANMEGADTTQCCKKAEGQECCKKECDKKCEK